jgi:hypothetical protein
LATVAHICSNLWAVDIRYAMCHYYLVKVSRQCSSWFCYINDISLHAVDVKKYLWLPFRRLYATAHPWRY